MSQCLSEQQLEELAAGNIPAQEAALWRAHVDACPECAEVYQEWCANVPIVGGVQSALRTSGTSIHVGRGSRLGHLSGLLDAGQDRAAQPAIPGYEIEHELHRGGQGVVYEAIQLSTRRKVAVKVLLEGPFASQRARRRFEREVELIAALRHPNIVAIHDSGITQHHCYFAMDYIQGSPLVERVRSAGLPVRSVVEVFRSVCEAVACAHRHGIMHRDLKPSNILVDESGTPYVLDFGLAKLTGSDLQVSNPAAVSIAGNLMGTLAYMSPEQTAGDPDAIDIRTDVYSLGVILYELLTGSPPYETAKADLTTAIKNIRDIDPPRLTKLRRDLNSELDAIVHKAMAKEPERRYQSASELAQELSLWLEGRPIAAKSASSLYVLRKLAVRHYFEALGIFAVVLAIFGFGLVEYGSARENAREARNHKQNAEALQAQIDWFNDHLPRLNAELGYSPQVMGWFLQRWQSGRPDAARQIMSRLPQNAPEAGLMRVLLDGKAVTPEQFLQGSPGTPEPMLYLVFAERSLHQGLTDEAVRCFRAAIHSPQHSDWYKSLAVARLEELGAPVSEQERKLVEQSRIGAVLATAPAGRKQSAVGGGDVTGN